MILRMERGLHVCKYHLSKNSRKIGRKTKIYNMLIFRLLSASTYTTKEETCQKISLCKENQMLIIPSKLS